MDTDDDYATTRESFSLVQNTLFIYYSDVLPAHSRTKYGWKAVDNYTICFFYKVLWTEHGVSLYRMYLLKIPGYTDRADVSPPICSIIMILKACSFFSWKRFFKNLSFQFQLRAIGFRRSIDPADMKINLLVKLLEVKAKVMRVLFLKIVLSPAWNFP